ncbi:hypothetical protein HON01_06725 [Candidatus Woesearchaeota archaeon]|nr:hypothetical protein [Candidatus Woesearchaeota archaeon]
MFIKSSKKEKIEAVKETLNLKNIFFAVVTIFSITWINPYLFPYLKIQPNIITNMLLIIFGFKLLEKILQENTHAFLIMVSIFRVFLNQQYFMTKTFLISFITMILLYIILLGFIRRLSDVYSNEVNISQLKSGMILGEGILKNGLKAPIKQSLRDTYILTKATALSKTDVQKIKKWHMTGKLHFNKIKVNKTIAFAPHLFLGTIITISCQGNILLFLQKVFL